MYAKLLFVAALASFGSQIVAMPVTWTLSGVTFVDGESATGSFVYDADSQSYSSWSITTKPTVDPTNTGYYFQGADYTTNNLLNAQNSDPLNSIQLHVKDLTFTGTHLKLFFWLPLTNSGGVIDLDPSIGNGRESLSIYYRNISSGTVVSSVPELSTNLLFTFGFVLLVTFPVLRGTTTKVFNIKKFMRSKAIAGAA